MLNSWEVDGIRAALEATFVELADIYRRTGNPDEYGGSADYVKIVSDCACDLHPVDLFRPRQFEGGGPISGSVQQDVVYQSLGFPVGTNVREGDRVDVYTQGTIVLIMQVQRGESNDGFVHAYGSVYSDSEWFHLNFHEGDHHS